MKFLWNIQIKYPADKCLWMNVAFLKTSLFLSLIAQPLSRMGFLPILLEMNELSSMNFLKDSSNRCFNSAHIF